MHSLEDMILHQKHLKILKNESMSKHTSWRIGGNADYFFQPKNFDEIQEVLSNLNDKIPIYMIGLGSNILVKDSGIRGLVICTKDMKEKIKLINNKVFVPCSIKCGELTRFGIEHKLSPTVFFSGIPGTIGGALAMNAGAFGFETWDYVESIKLINSSGQIEIRSREQFEIGYREVSFSDQEFFLEACFIFKNQAHSKDELRKIVSVRKEKQPIGEKNCGSVFKNTKDYFAGELIEKAGLKGLRIGGAEISNKHANFINNLEDASSRDIEELINKVIKEVEAKFKVQLEKEVRILG